MKQQNSLRVGGVILLFVALFARTTIFIRENVVELFYSREWDFLEGLFNGESWGTLFRWQSDSYRMGLGYMLIKLNSLVGPWSERSLALMIASALLFAGLLAYALKLRLSHADKWRDLAIPFFFLNLFQWELYVGVPNPAHGSVPLLLAILMAWSLTLASRSARYSTFLALNLLSIHTGFGYLLGLCVPIYLGLQIRGRRRSKLDVGWEISALVISMLSLAYFFYQYLLPTKLENAPWGLILFVAALAATASILWVTGSRIARHSDKSFKNSDSIVFLMSGYSLAYTWACALGLVGPAENSHELVSRSVPYLVPAIFALNLFFGRAPRKSFAGITRNALLLLFVVLNLKVGFRTQKSIDTLSLGKRTWALCYRQNKDLDWCDQKSGFVVHPNYPATRLGEKLEYLREHKLSLYRD